MANKVKFRTMAGKVKLMKKCLTSTYFFLKQYKNLACLFALYMFANCSGAFLNTTNLFSSLPSVEGESDNIPDKEFFYIKISEAYYRGTHGFNLLDYEMYESTNGPGYDCKIPIDEESTTEDMYCMFEVLEGDLFFHELRFEYNAPPGMCDFVFFQTHWHYNQKSGYGPETVYKRKRYKPDRQFCPIRDFSGLCSDGCKETRLSADVDLSERKVSCDKEDGEDYCLLDERNIGPDEDTCKETASEVCQYNNTHSKEEGENCCIGEYDLYTFDKKRSPKKSEEPESEDVSWGGDLRQCIGGLGRFAWEDGYSPDGFPSILIENSKAGLRKTYQIPAIIEKLDAKYKTRSCDGGVHPKQRSFVTANHWIGIKDGTDRPKFYNSDDKNNVPDKHIYLKKPGYPYITFECKDQAYEVKHRIHLIIREWNSTEEFKDFKSGGTGDPDVAGKAGDDCEYYEDGDYKLEDGTCNDMMDVEDWTATCGDKYPKLDYSN